MATRKTSRSSKKSINKTSGKKKTIKAVTKASKKKLTPRKTKAPKATLKKQLNSFHRNTIRLHNNEPQFEILMDVPVRPVRRHIRPQTRVTDMRRTLLNEDAPVAPTTPAAPQPNAAPKPETLPEAPKELPASPEIPALPEKPVEAAPAPQPKEVVSSPMAMLRAEGTLPTTPSTPEPQVESPAAEPVSPAPEASPMPTPAPEAPTQPETQSSTLPISNVVMIRSVSPLQTPYAHSSREYVQSSERSRVPAILVSSFVLVFAILMGTAIIGRVQTGSVARQTPKSSAVAGAEISLQSYRSDSFTVQYPTTWTMQKVKNTLTLTDVNSKKSVMVTSSALTTDFASWLKSEKKSISSLTRVADSGVLHYSEQTKQGLVHYLVGSDTIVVVSGDADAAAQVVSGFRFQ